MADFMAEDAEYVMHTYGRLPIEPVLGHGSTLVDSTGKEYLDFLAGVGAVSLGHCNPVVRDALAEQVGKVWQTSNYFYAENRAELAHDLSDLLSKTTDTEGHITGSTGTKWQAFFGNSGAEANEGAIKVARRWGEEELGGATGILTAQRSFHGRTLATLAATGQAFFHKSFLPMPAGFAAFPLNDADALEAAIVNPPAGTGPLCAVMLECIQGEGGVWPAEATFLKRARELCSEHHLMLIIDEVQTGFFRTGAPFAYQLAGIEPDIVSLAKGIADGFPMGAVCAREEVASLMHPGDHGSTFGGSCLAIAACAATLSALVRGDYADHAAKVGAYMEARLAKLPHVTEVRGRGLMLGCDLDDAAGDAHDVVARALVAGTVINATGAHTLRFLPPLVCEEADVDSLIEILAGVLA